MTDQSAVTARPPRSWELQTVAVLVAVAAATLLGMVLFAGDLALRAYVGSNGASGMSPMVGWLATHATDVDLIYLLLVLGYVGGLAWWQRSTRAMLRLLGGGTGDEARHWAVMAWNTAIFLAFAIRMSASSSDDPQSALGTHALQAAVRILGLGLLLFGVWQIRDQVRRAVAEAGVTLRIGDIAPRPSAVPLRLPAPVARRPAPAIETLPVADDEFFGRVRQAATGRRADLALLETTGPLVHRWALVPESGDLDAVRAALPPGAVVTVFPEPPEATETKGFTPAPADEYYGFLEDGETGALWFQSVTAKRVPAFLARARSARRWTLYRVDEPAALTAVVPDKATP